VSRADSQRPRNRREQILAGIDAGVPVIGPATVHVDVTNACNAACVSCWDHSPLLAEPRPSSWKRVRLPVADFRALVGSLDEMGSVRSVIFSGMGEPLLHPDIYDMIALARARGWDVTVLSNLVAADTEALVHSGVTSLLAGIHGVTPESYGSFHAGWGEKQFFIACRNLRELRSAGVPVRHVHAITRATAPELVAMVRFGKTFRADRVNFKLASLGNGTEVCGVTAEQCSWLLGEAIPEARETAAQLAVATNLDVFETQVRAATGDARATTAMDEVGCFMGFVYARVSAERTVYFCCNTEIEIGSLDDASFAELWHGHRWQAVRARLRRGDFFAGCSRCGKLEQNLRWSQRYLEYAGERRWREAIGRARSGELPVVAPETAPATRGNAG